jgi:RND family efflux transporter MFP subunit
MSRSRFNTYVLPGLALLALAGGVASIASHQTAHSLAEPATPPPTPPAAQAASIGAVGLVESASEEIGIAAAVSGPVTAVPVQPGQHVRAGDVLFAIDDRQARADLAVHRADLDSARARLAEAAAAQADLADQLARAERLSKISGGVSISEDTLLRRRYASRTVDAHVESARAEVASAEATVASAQVTLDRLTVRAPIDGTVLQVNVRVGEYAPAEPMATPLVIMGQLTPLHIRTDIDETDVPRFDPRAPAWASPRGAADRRTKLTLVRVDPLVVPKKSLTGAGTERVDTRVLRVVYAFDPRELAAYPGQQMDVFVALRPEAGP